MFRLTKSLETRISTRIQLPDNFDNRVIEVERNSLIFSCVVCLKGNWTYPCTDTLVYNCEK